MKKARFQLILSMIVFGTLAPFVRNVSLPSAEVALYRAVMAALLIGGFLLLSHQKHSFKGMKKELPLLFLSGAALAVNWILLFQAYRYTSVSAATLSYYFAPVLVTVASPFLFREKLSHKQILCFVLSTIGVLFITGIPDLTNPGRDTIGILLGLGAACFYAAVILLNKFIRKVRGILRTFLQFIAAIIVLVPYLAFTGGFHLSSLDGFGWGNLLIIGILHTGITYCLYFTSLKALPGQEAAILSYIDPLVAVAVSVIILDEPITLLQILGAFLILGFAVWNELD